MAATRRWTLFIVGFVLVTLAFHSGGSTLRSGTGGLGPTIFQAAFPSAAIMAMLAAIMVSAVIAVGIARLVTPLSGLAIVGAGLGWWSLNLESMRGVVSEGSMPLLAADGMAWTLVVLVLGWLVIRFGQPVSDVKPAVEQEPPDPLLSPDAVRILVCGLAAIPVVWIFAANDLRGQAVCAAIVGGLAAGMAGRLFSPHVQPVILPAAVVLAGTLSMWVVGMMLPEEVAVAWARGDIPNLLRLSPIDWAVGGLLGVPMGFKWGSSFLNHEDEPVATR